jgi:hypothetical protein
MYDAFRPRETCDSNAVRREPADGQDEAASAPTTSGRLYHNRDRPYVARSSPGGGATSARGNAAVLESIPQELVVDLMVILHLRGFYERTKEPRTAISRGLLQFGIPAPHIFS